MQERIEKVAASAPGVLVQAQDLDRDYSILKRNYQELVARREATAIANAADTKTEKIQFRIVDPPQVPILPAAPNRPMLVSMVLLFGIGAGLAVPLALTQIDRSFATIGQLRNLGLPILGSVYAAVARRGAAAGRDPVGGGMRERCSFDRGIWDLDRSEHGAPYDRHLLNGRNDWTDRTGGSAAAPTGSCASPSRPSRLARPPADRPYAHRSGAGARSRAGSPSFGIAIPSAARSRTVEEFRLVKRNLIAAWSQSDLIGDPARQPADHGDERTAGRGQDVQRAQSGSGLRIGTRASKRCSSMSIRSIPGLPKILGIPGRQGHRRRARRKPRTVGSADPDEHPQSDDPAGGAGRAARTRTAVEPGNGRPAGRDDATASATTISSSTRRHAWRAATPRRWRRWSDRSSSSSKRTTRSRRRSKPRSACSAPVPGSAFAEQERRSGQRAFWLLWVQLSLRRWRER